MSFSDFRDFRSLRGSKSSAAWVLLGLSLSRHLGVDVSDKALEVTIHLGEHLKALLRGSIVRLVFALLIGFGDARGERCLALTDSVDVLLILVVLRLLVSLALSGHLGEVGLANLLLSSAAHLGLDATNEGLLAGVISSETSLLDAVLDIAVGQELSLLNDLISSVLELLAKRAKCCS